MTAQRPPTGNTAHDGTAWYTPSCPDCGANGWLRLVPDKGPDALIVHCGYCNALLEDPTAPDDGQEVQR